MKAVDFSQEITEPFIRFFSINGRLTSISGSIQHLFLMAQKGRVRTIRETYLLREGSWTMNKKKISTKSEIFEIGQLVVSIDHPKIYKNVDKVH